MKTIVEGKSYVITTSDNKEVPIVFPGKDETGAFAHGIPAEELIEVLIGRYKYFVFDLDKGGSSNMNVLTYLKKVKELMKRRNYSKLKNNKPHAIGAGDAV